MNTSFFLPISLAAAFLPSLFSQSDAGIVGAGYGSPAVPAVAPGQVITLFVGGGVSSGGDVAVSLRQSSEPGTVAVPVMAVKAIPTCPPGVALECKSGSTITAVTVQLPFEMTPPAANGTLFGTSEATLSVTSGGRSTAEFRVTPVTDAIHILNSCTDSAIPFYGASQGLCGALVTHSDGTLVTAASPALPPEAVTVYAYGFGATLPAVATGQPSPLPAASVAPPVQVQFEAAPNAGSSRRDDMTPVAPLFAGLTPGCAGLYQINVVVPQLPAGAAACGGAVESNLTIRIRGQRSHDAAGICVRVR